METGIGALEFTDGYPTVETAATLRDHLDYLHGVETFMNTVSGVSVYAIRQGFLDAGINDWGGVSPLTPDFINPERPWPHLHELEERTRAAGFVLRQRLPVYPEFLPLVAGRPGLVADRVLAASDARGYSRRAA